MKHLKPVKIFVFLIALHATTTAIASPNVLHPCKEEWGQKNQHLQSVSSLRSLQDLEKRAEAGSVVAQYRLGLVWETRDGKWKAPEDRSHQKKWLGKAAEAGHKWAAAKLAGHQFSVLEAPSISYEAYLKALIAAAEAGDPLSASTLMYISEEGEMDDCKSIAYQNKEMCTPLGLVLATDRSRWAEIAATGGNPYAQHWLCTSTTWGLGRNILPKDPAAISAKWCHISEASPCIKGIRLWGHDEDIFNPNY